MDLDDHFQDTMMPVQRDGIDYSALTVMPSQEEFFLLSRIDGHTSVGQLCQISGLGRRGTLSALSTLFQAGLIEVPGMEAPGSEHDGDAQAASAQDAAAPEARPAETGAPSKRKASRSTFEPNYSYYPVSLEAFEPDPEELDENLEMDRARQREVLYVDAMLDSVNYYELLGVDRDSERRAIRTSFFGLSKRFHSDSFFRKDIGEYRGRMERIFTRLVEAHEVLKNKRKRQAYDEALERYATGLPPVPDVPGVDLSQVSEGGRTPEERKRDTGFLLMQRQGEKLEAAGDFVGAAQAYQKAFTIKRDATVALKASMLLFRAGDHNEEAAVLARAAMREMPDSALPHVAMARIYESDGHLELAIAHYNQALELDPTNVHARGGLEKAKARVANS